ncbi:MAG: (2Fe-2S)-binding protein, partial [Alphaproteobacteria bacterium]|nr:(2Fe-2S)-binding protein [Alphaproteobacteria bacterium]
MLRRPVEPEGNAAVRLTIAGQSVTARRGESVATAALAAGLQATRNAPVSGEPRAP